MEQAGMNHDGNLQIRMLDQLYNRYLTTSCEGGWYDAINSDGQIVSTDMPSSTFYHIFCAIVEYLEHNDALNFTTTG
jgi:mannose/cellobiose epimerase-like protein (N-acyl-D-glucosamine 2-epimerase family)